MSQLKVTAMVIFLLALLLAGYNYAMRGNKINTLNQTVGSQATTIVNQNTAIRVDKASDAVTDKGTGQVAAEQQAIEKRFDQAVRESDQVETRVKNKYDKLVADEKAKSPMGVISAERQMKMAIDQANELSIVRMDVLRQYLCDIDPSPEHCGPMRVLP